MARYRVFFYRDYKGREPMREWLEELRRYQPHLAQTASRLLQELQELGPDMRPPKVKSFRHKGVLVHELRKRTREGAMRIYYLRFDRVFLAVAGEVKKEDHPDERLLDLVVQAYQEEVN